MCVEQRGKQASSDTNQKKQKSKAGSPQEENGEGERRGAQEKTGERR